MKVVSQIGLTENWLLKIVHFPQEWIKFGYIPPPPLWNREYFSFVKFFPAPKTDFYGVLV